MSPPRDTLAARRALRFGLAGAALAYAWAAWTHDSALNELAVLELGASEAVARGVDRGAAVVLVVAAVGAWFERGRVAWGLAALWMLLQAVAEARLGGAPLVEWEPAAHAARWLAPFALVALVGGRVRRAELLLRVGAAATFAVHGVQALVGVPRFVDLVLLSARRVALAPSEVAVERALVVVGLLDLAAAALVVTTRRRAVAGYMALWGAVTLLARVTAGGWVQWPAAGVRLEHAAAPLALLLLWSPRTRSSP
ncbi:MAG: hypothetical protein H6828_12465 [Planctomycetes bacterium]|nr:hypothetical protein [Planctomycetota bacterium]